MIHPLKRYREQEGLTQHELGDLLGVSRTAVARWETGRRKVGRGSLADIGTKTGIPAKELRPDLIEEAARLLREPAE